MAIRPLQVAKPQPALGGPRTTAPIILLENNFAEVVGKYNLVAVRQNDRKVSKELKEVFRYQQIALLYGLSVDDFRARQQKFSHIPLYCADALGKYQPKKRFARKLATKGNLVTFDPAALEDISEADFYAQDVSVDLFVVRCFLSRDGTAIHSRTPQKSVLYAVPKKVQIELHGESRQSLYIKGEEKRRDPLDGTVLEEAEQHRQGYVYTLDKIVHLTLRREYFRPSRDSLKIYFIDKTSHPSFAAKLLADIDQHP